VNDTTNLERQLRGDEGRDKFVYPDSEGWWTIGIGRLVDKRKGGGLRDAEIDFMFRNDVQDRVDALQQVLPWFIFLDIPRQGVLLNMSFQLGVDGLLAFKQTLSFVKQGAHAQAAASMLKSLWAQQTPARAQRLAKQMETGEWQFAPGA
jgi:lysozyme